MLQDFGKKKFIGWGILAGLALLGFYFSVLTLANSFSHALEQFSQQWYWILILASGFGIQVGLYTFIREGLRAAPSRVLATSGGISTGSMIACCLHHLVEVLPIIGLAAISLFLIKYQVFFLLIGIFSNLVGIILMLEIIKKNSLAGECLILSRIVKLNLKLLKNWLIGIFIVLLLFFLFLIKNKNQNSDLIASPTGITKAVGQGSQTSTSFLSLPPKINEAGNLSIEITPINFSFNKPVEFEIFLNTHQGNLDFDLVKKSVLVDDQNKQYLPFSWEGDNGGHHLSGKLIFPPLSKTKTLKLIINNVYGVPSREFFWELE